MQASRLLVAALVCSFGWCSTVVAQSASSPAPVAWAFGGAQAAGAGGWTAERGTMTAGDGALRLQPDANRRVVLLSPPSLPDDVRNVDAFVLGVDGTGLLRVRIQGRRDARGGWITLADARGKALVETADGVAVKRSAPRTGAPIERIRIEMEFRTTNPRSLASIVVRPAKP